MDPDAGGAPPSDDRDAHPLLKAKAQEALRLLASNVDTGLSDADAASRLVRSGPNEVAEEHPSSLLLLAKKFWGLSAWMIELIVVLSWFLRRHAELAIAATLLCLNALIGFFQDRRSSNAVRALRSRLCIDARVLRGGAWKRRPARELVAGDIVRVRSGDFVPADATIVEGCLGVDQSSLTGESMEVSREADGLVYSGSVVRRGEATMVVVFTGARTYFGRTTQLVQSACPKLHLEAVVANVVRRLFVIVGVLVAAATAVALTRGIPIGEILPLSLVLLLGAVPVALPVMFTVSMAIGSMELARRGVLVTRLSAAEDAAGMDVLCIDKTGTITENRLVVGGAIPREGFDEHDVIRYGALASQEANQDPIDLAFLTAARDRNAGAAARIFSFMPFTPDTRRTEAVVEVDGRRLRVLKGALRSVGEACGLDPAEIASLEARATDEARKGRRVLAVGATLRDERPILVGLATLIDPPRSDSRRLIDELRGHGVAVKMLTGDALPIAEEVARTVGLGRIRRVAELRAGGNGETLADGTDGFAEVYPEDKFTVVGALQKAGHLTGMTGDGVNDAPALKQAEVGIAVKSAADVAKAAASVVLTTEGLTGIVDLVRNGRVIHQRILTWIVNKISRTILKTALVTGAFLITGRFVITALGMMFLIFMTDFVKIALATDRAPESPQPTSWRIGGWVKVGPALGVLLSIEAAVLLALGWHLFGLGGDAEALSTFTFLMLLLFAIFSLLSVRERGPFWNSRPGPLLSTMLALDVVAGLALATLGAPGLHVLPPLASLTVFAYSFATVLVLNDFAKRAFIRWFTRMPTPSPAVP